LMIYFCKGKYGIVRANFIKSQLITIEQQGRISNIQSQLLHNLYEKAA